MIQSKENKMYVYQPYSYIASRLTFVNAVVECIRMFHVGHLVFHVPPLPPHSSISHHKTIVFPRGHAKHGIAAAERQTSRYLYRLSALRFPER
jgi:hypothetical protein